MTEKSSTNYIEGDAAPALGAVSVPGADTDTVAVTLNEALTPAEAPAQGTETDDALYRQFRAGDGTSYDQLMVRYGDSVTRYLYGYVHDMQEAEDLMIDAFTRILVKKPVIGEGAFKAYIYRTARNLALRFHQRKLRLQTFSIEGLEEQGLETQALDKDTVESSLSEQERNRILYQCLERIEPELREALWLVYVEGFSYAQTAAIMGVKPKRVDRLLARGKQSMRRELEQEGVTNAYDR